MSTPKSPRPENLIGCTVADRYRIESAIGDGGMATVYRASQVHLRRAVALKVLKSRYCGHPESVERFVREARAASAIRSPYVVDILDVGEITGTTVFIAMELLEGPTLEELLAQENQLDWPRAHRLALQMIRGLRAVHEHGIVHRDIKPSNCIITRNGQGEEHVKILDFGIAKLSLGASDQELTQTGAIFGTAKYMSPEQARGKRVDARTDIYAFGVILFEMLAGRVPFDGDNFPQVATQHAKDPPPSLAHLGLPPGVECLIQRCLAKTPQERYPSMRDLEQELLSLRSESNLQNPPPMTVPEGTVVLKNGGLPANYPRRVVKGAPTPRTTPISREPSPAPEQSTQAEAPAVASQNIDVRSTSRGPTQVALPLALASGALLLVALFAWWSVQDHEIQALAERQRITPSALVPATAAPPPSVPPAPKETPTPEATLVATHIETSPPVPDKKTEKTKHPRPRHRKSRASRPPLSDLSRADVRKALAAARRLIQAKCNGPGLAISIKVEMHVLPNGKLIASRALPPFNRSDLGACVERYARLARFPRRDRQTPTVLVETFRLGSLPP